MAQNSLLPPPAHVAIAIVLLKSKPQSLSVDEYLRQIRSAISKSTNNLPVEQQSLDNVSFWKRAFEASEVEKSNLRDKLIDLEQRYNASLPFHSSTPIKDRPKTRCGLQPTAKANTQSKRKRVESSEDEGSIERELGHGENETSSSSALLRSLYALRRLQNHVPIFLESKIFTITASCHSIVRAINIGNDKHVETMISYSKSSSANTCQVVILVWDAIVSALSTLEHDEIRCCLPHLIMAFQSVLDQLHKESLNEAVRRDEHLVQRRKKSKSNTKIVKDDTKEKSEYSRKLCEVLATAAVRMLTTKGLSQVSCTTLFEGLACAFLDHLGSSLSLSLFGDPEVKDQSELGLMPPRGLSSNEHTDTKVAIATVLIEAPYLIYILKHTPQLLGSNSKNNNINGSEDSDQKNQDKSSLWTISQCKLQHTLLRAIFGDDDPIFQDALRRVKMAKMNLAEKSDISINIDMETSEWFLGQVWENVGWDILVES